MEKYLDDKLSFKERAMDLVSKMTIEEKAAQLLYDAPEIKRLNIPSYNYWNEALHGVARSGTATVFPQAIALASLFDEDLMYKVADIISTETRAKYNESKKYNDTGIYKGLTMWSPNVNIFRDPRWGRGQETYGEDPYLTSRLGVAFVKGLQGDGKYLKTSACAKHYAVHSGPEDIRHVFDAVVNKKDLFETYLPQFEALVKEAKVESVMGAYNRTLGEVCCAHDYLMNDILRKDWGFDGHYVSDFGALHDFHANHKITKNDKETTAKAIKAGCDINAGWVYPNVMDVYKEKMITEEDMDKCLYQVMASRIKLGMFDKTKYDNLNLMNVDTKEHREFNLSIAEKTMVLLKNDGILPLDKNKIKTIGVVGSSADSLPVLIANYYGTCGKSTTILRGIQDYVKDDVRVLYSEGCHKIKDKVEVLAKPNDRISEALAVANNSDVVVVCLGLDETLEGEELHESTNVLTGDKVDLNLPRSQEILLEKMIETNKPIILVLTTGSAMSINLANEKCNAVLQAWYPGAEGGNAVARTLFGESNPSGKLPITFYKTVEELPEFTNYDMKNRTYKFMKNDALYPFGFGLSYSTFKYSNLKIDVSDNVIININVSNTSKVSGDEIVQCYYSVLDKASDLPKYSLCKFKRVTIINEETVNVTLEIPRNSFSYVDKNGKTLLANEIELFVGGNQPDKVSEKLIDKVLSSKIKF